MMIDDVSRSNSKADVCCTPCRYQASRMCRLKALSIAQSVEHKILWSNLILLFLLLGFHLNFERDHQ